MTMTVNGVGNATDCKRSDQYWWKYADGFY